ncbi:hypothetical protein [Streptomyces sp. URMC 123]|uniref:hypothetical protein n=1 Tax=Streptomyces sp. URMC 123 TaxID=3423403 RepID=UPI003F1AA3F8
MAQVHFGVAPRVALAGGQRVTLNYFWPGIMTSGTWQHVSGCPDAGTPPGNVRMEVNGQSWDFNDNNFKISVTWTYFGMTSAQANFAPTLTVIAP